MSNSSASGIHLDPGTNHAHNRGACFFTFLASPVGNVKSIARAADRASFRPNSAQDMITSLALQARGPAGQSLPSTDANRSSGSEKSVPKSHRQPETPYPPRPFCSAPGPPTKGNRIGLLAGVTAIDIHIPKEPPETKWAWVNHLGGDKSSLLHRKQG